MIDRGPRVAPRSKEPAGCARIPRGIRAALSLLAVTLLMSPPAASGQVELAPSSKPHAASICRVPEVLDFGEFSTPAYVGVTVDSTFYIFNDSTEPMTGSVEWVQPHYVFSIQEGEGPYTLAPADSHAVTIRIHVPPQYTARVQAVLATGCGQITVTALSYYACFLEPSYINFGIVQPGAERTDTVFVTRMDRNLWFRPHFWGVGGWANSLDAFSWSGPPDRSILQPDTTNAIAITFRPTYGFFQARFVASELVCGSTHVLGRTPCAPLEPGHKGLKLQLGEESTVTYRVSNEGPTQLPLNPTVGGDPADEISVDAPPTIDPGDTVSVRVTWKPTGTSRFLEASIDLGECGPWILTGFSYASILKDTALSLVVRPSTEPLGCESDRDTILCAASETRGNLGVLYDVYVVATFYDFPGGDWREQLQRASFGVSYDPEPGSGVDVLDWSSCGDDVGYGDWPNPTGGITVSWGDSVCSRLRYQDQRVIGWFTVMAYGEDRLELTGSPEYGDSRPRLETCVGGYVQPRKRWVGYAVFSDNPDESGCNPCVGSCDPLVGVRTVDLAALRDADGAIIRFRVLGDDAMGSVFTVYREESDGSKVQLFGAGLVDGGSSEVRDPDPPPTRTAYWVSEVNRSGETRWFGPAWLEAANPTPMMLGAVVPNPSFASTTIPLSLPTAADVRVEIFDLAGRRVSLLHDGPMEAGNHTMTWDGRLLGGGPAPAGIYVIRLRTRGEVFTRKFVRLGNSL